ncbi:MAG: DNA repair protein RecN [Lachnospiraceae bacterium]|nr:DNA repair protein RecN [Lachnospiraceae bacterium]
MLVSLHVKDLALIEENEVFWENGLNILTGETGAGKSVIIGSVRLALGAAMNSVLGSKGDKDCIRTGAQYALVELVFQTKRNEIFKKMEELELPLEEDGSIFIQRKIMPGRSVCKVNGETVAAKQLKDLASLLIAIHGQHDTQTLLNVKKHSQIVDDFASELIFPLKDKLKEAYRTYTNCKKEFLQASEDEKQQERELALAQFEVDEISNARLVVGEDEELEERYRKMNNSRKIAEAVSRVSQAIGTENESGAGIGISFALRELKAVSALDSELADMEEQLIQVEDMLSDLDRNVASYLDSLEFSQEEYMMVEERLNVYNHLKNKYGNTVEEVLAYYEKQSSKLEKMADYEGYLNALQEKMEEAEADVIAYSRQLSGLRIEAAGELGRQMNDALLDLNFANVDFEVAVTSDESIRSEEGFEDIEFMISLNPGEPRKPLTMVASGGELSRIMLALKTIMADKENIETLIFDEIDSGISGRTAWKVSEKMAVLGREHQLICITHLPQIAAMADAHYVIEKTVDESAAITEIRRLDSRDELTEIARLLGSDSITETVLANAKELKEMANQTKGY